MLLLSRRQAIVGQEFLIPLSYDGQVRPHNKSFRKQQYSSVREVNGVIMETLKLAMKYDN